MVLREFRQVLIHVKDDGYADDQKNGIDVGANELLDDVSIQPFDIVERIDIFHPSHPCAQPLEETPQPTCVPVDEAEEAKKPCRVLRKMAHYPVKPAMSSDLAQWFHVELFRFFVRAGR